MKLNHLTDSSLLKDIGKLAQEERNLNGKILWHLKEIDRRKLFVELKYSSLFDFCVRILKYSEGQASGRVAGARLLKNLPEIAANLEEGSLNLTQLNQLSYFFREENIRDPARKIDILKKIENKSTRETERILQEHRKGFVERNVFLVIKEQTKKRLDKVRDLKAHTCPDNDSLLGKMCEEVSKIWDPTLIKRHMSGSTETRFIPKVIQAEVWRRDKGACTKCDSTFALEFDHIQPFAMGGKSTVENLRLLCRACNQRQRFTNFPDKSAFQLKRPPG